MEKNWLSILLIYADFREGKGILLDENLVIHLRILFGELAKATLSDSAKAFVVINRIFYKPVAAETVQTAVTDDKTFVYELKKREEGKTNALKRYVSASPTLAGGIHPIQQHKPLTEVFREIQQENADRNVFLMTWDHGSVFGVFKDENEPETIKIEKFEPLDHFRNYFSELDGFADDLFETHDFLKANPQERPAFMQNAAFEQPVYSYRDIKFRSDSNKFIDTIIKKHSGESKNDYKVSFKQNARWIEVERADGASIDVVPELFANGWKERPGEDNSIDSALRHRLPIITEDAVPGILANEELAKAITEGFGKKIDVLLMMNCTMMNIHACYAFKDQVDYLVAPQGIIGHPGYNYKAIFSRVLGNSKQDVSPMDLAASCVHSTFAFDENDPDFDLQRAPHKDYIKRWAVFCYKLAEFGRMSDQVDALAGYLVDNWDRLGVQVANARMESFPFIDPKLNYFLVDITHFLDLLLKKATKTGIDDLFLSRIQKFIDDIAAIRNDIIKVTEQEVNDRIYHMAWMESLYKRNPEAVGFGIPNASGLSIYFPINLDEESYIFKHFAVPNSSLSAVFLKEKPSWLSLLRRLPEVSGGIHTFR